MLTYADVCEESEAVRLLPAPVHNPINVCGTFQPDSLCFLWSYPVLSQGNITEEITCSSSMASSEVVEESLFSRISTQNESPTLLFQEFCHGSTDEATNKVEAEKEAEEDASGTEV
jgi:hypothetical protein